MRRVNNASGEWHSVDVSPARYKENIVWRFFVETTSGRILLVRADFLRALPFVPVGARPGICSRYEKIAGSAANMERSDCPTSKHAVLLTPVNALLMVISGIMSRPDGRVRDTLEFLLRCLEKMLKYLRPSEHAESLATFAEDALARYLALLADNKHDALQKTPCPTCRRPLYSFELLACCGVRDAAGSVCGGKLHLGPHACDAGGRRVPVLDVLLASLLHSPKIVPFCRSCDPGPFAEEKTADGQPSMRAMMINELFALMKEPSAFVFIHPVDVRAYPNYPEFVSDPMDLATIMYKVCKGRISSLKVFDSHVRLMFRNALQFNHPTSWVTKVAKELSKKFSSLIALRPSCYASAEPDLPTLPLGPSRTKRPRQRLLEEDDDDDVDADALATKAIKKARLDYVMAAAAAASKQNISGLDLARQKVADMNSDDLLAVVYKVRAEVHPMLAQFKQSIEGVESTISALQRRCRELSSTLNAKVQAMSVRHDKELQSLLGKLSGLVDT